MKFRDINEASTTKDLQALQLEVAKMLRTMADQLTNKELPSKPEVTSLRAGWLKKFKREFAKNEKTFFDTFFKLRGF